MDNQTIEATVIESVNKGVEIYKKVIDDNFFCYKLTLDCADLVDIELKSTNEKRLKHDLPESLKISFFRAFDLLHNSINKKPCLYFFEFKEGLADQIHTTYKEFCSNNGERNKSGLKGKPDLDTNILYVGKVKKDVGARLSTHFGYANSQTGGLQLKYWAKQIGLKLEVNIIVFDVNIGDYINPLELELTKILKPLIGKSK
ncbi:MAG TPA: hypothetical protein VMW01_01980 [Williamwhitmania sp.]|nr:hypothetical protein [Williamwhitmania sp.]